MLNPTNTPSALRDRSRSDTCRHIRTAVTGQIAGHLRLTMTQVRISKLSSEIPMDQWLRKPFKQHLCLLCLMWKAISHLVNLKIYKMQRMTMNTWRRRAIAGSVPFELLWRLWSVCEPRTRPPHFPLGAVSLTPESIDLRQWAQRSLDGSPHIGSSHSHPTAASRHQHRWRRDQGPSQSCMAPYSANWSAHGHDSSSFCSKASQRHSHTPHWQRRQSTKSWSTV